MIRVYGDTGTEVNEMEGRENRGEKEAMEVKEHHAGHVSVCPMPVERDDYRFLALARSSQNLGHRFVNELTCIDRRIDLPPLLLLLLLLLPLANHRFVIVIVLPDVVVFV
ncbi:uncharacterized protein LOC105737436 isoform X1 [Apis florea]|uniref:uncharacterized protein LOC105737436 isoform X1 n=1 Tax=Apis florea TaxID=7463 RepID=UPI0006290B7E|nr:uncharacterized protein LOC105737436 isoform X1 [Apis florea]